MPSILPLNGLIIVCLILLSLILMGYLGVIRTLYGWGPLLFWGEFHAGSTISLDPHGRNSSKAKGIFYVFKLKSSLSFSDIKVQCNSILLVSLHSHIIHVYKKVNRLRMFWLTLVVISMERWFFTLSIVTSSYSWLLYSR